MRISEADLRAYLDQGWNVIYTNISLEDRPEWGMWECIRELVQNALDETGGYRTRRGKVQGKPTLFVEDDGKGMFMVNLIMGSGQKPSWARGRFGEGLKYACLVALREGYDVEIETVGATILPVILEKEIFEPRTKRSVVVPILSFLYRSSDRKQGTSVAIIGYDGIDFSDRFAVNRKDVIVSYNLFVSKEPKVVYKVQMFSGDEDPPGVRRLYVRDIYVADMDKLFSGAKKALYSYNLYDVDLTRERNTPESPYQVSNGIGDVIGRCKDKSIISKILKVVSRDQHMEYVESRANVDISSDALSAWREAFKEVFGARVALFTDRKFARRAEWEGYRVVHLPSYWHYSIRGYLEVPEDQQIAEKVIIKRIYQAHELTEHAEKILRFFEKLTEVIFRTFPSPKYLREAPAFRIGELFDAVGATTEKEIVFSPQALTVSSAALDVYVHELAHFTSGAEDLTRAHLHEISKVASHVALTLATRADLRAMLKELVDEHFGKPLLVSQKQFEERVKRLLEEGTLAEKIRHVLEE